MPPLVRIGLSGRPGVARRACHAGGLLLPCTPGRLSAYLRLLPLPTAVLAAGLRGSVGIGGGACSSPAQVPRFREGVAPLLVLPLCCGLLPDLVGAHSGLFCWGPSIVPSLLPMRLVPPPWVW